MISLLLFLRKQGGGSFVMLYALSGISTFDMNKNTIPLRINAYDYRAIFLFSACLIYALFGSPTPDRLGLVDAVLIFLLALSVGIAHMRGLLVRSAGHRFWKSAGQISLIYGLSIPLAVGAMAGHSFGAMLRDIVPFACLFLPLFCLPVIRARPRYFRTTLLGLILIGLLFGLRSLVMRFDISCAIDVWCANDELLYLENMPTVLFSCLFLFGSAITYAVRGISLRHMFVFGSLIALALIPLAAMIFTLQRASIGAVVVYIACVYSYFFYKKPFRALGALFLGVAALYVVDISLEGVFASLWDKTRNVGLNMRPQEMAAVWEIVRRDPVTLLFGIGWGGHFNSPAVGGLSVNFTHNFFSSMFLKSGLIGVIFCSAYIAGLLERLVRVIKKNTVFGLAIAAPILIDLTLYASFKSLDFGLVLLMIPASLVYFRQFESR